MNRGLPSAIVGGALYIAGCSISPCRSGLPASGRYRVTVHEPYAEGGEFTFSSSLTKRVAPNRCDGPFGAGTGAQLEFRTTETVVNRENGACTVVVAELTATSAGAVVVVGPSKNALVVNQVQAISTYFYAAHEVEIGGCRGSLGFEVIPGRAPDGLFSAPVPGQYPPAVLYRLFLPENGDAGPSCSFCDDAFVAELERVVE